MLVFTKTIPSKVHIFWEGHKILRNVPLTFEYSTYGQKLGEDFAKFLWPSQDIWTLILSRSSLLSYEFTEASNVKDSEIEIQDRYENTILSSDFNKDGFSDAFSDFDKELKQEVDAIKKGLDVTELGTS